MSPNFTRYVTTETTGSGFYRVSKICDLHSGHHPVYGDPRFHGHESTGRHAHKIAQHQTRSFRTRGIGLCLQRRYFRIAYGRFCRQIRQKEIASLFLRRLYYRYYFMWNGHCHYTFKLQPITKHLALQKDKSAVSHLMHTIAKKIIGLSFPPPPYYLSVDSC